MEQLLFYLTDLGDIVLRSLLSLAVLFIITRIMGKKQISQLTFFDYVIGISIGSIAAEMAATDQVPYRHGVTATIVSGMAAWLISVVTNKSMKARRFFTGHTFLLVDKGKILEKNLALVKYDINDLLSEARNAGYFDIADIEYALLETNGKISFLPKADKTPPTLGDLHIKKPSSGLTANVIIDGHVMAENLQMAGLNEEWLKQELKAQTCGSISHIILATVSGDNPLTVYEKTGRAVRRTQVD